MDINMIREQYENYCKRMKEHGVEFAIIPFKEFKKAMEESERSKNV